ncbi:MAG: hypothetical protein GX146_07580 [Myxococcales bacterium]|nr:hypothetical protein [Myxococcales bacterium]
MPELCVAAPGKLFLSGEYAVLRGAPAIVSAVDRWMYARCTAENHPRNGLIAHVNRAVTDFLHARYERNPGQLPNLHVHNEGFAIGQQKIGIGSSAAVAAAATGALFAWAGLDIDAYRAQIGQTAKRAHYEAQGKKGSGADVITSVMGGTILFRRGAVPVAIAAPQVHHRFVWTGAPASTVALMRDVQRLERQQPAQHRHCFDALAGLALSLAEAYQRGDAPDIVALTEAYGAQMQRLGEASGAPIVTPAHAQIRTLAAELGGAAKPSGAGGGDVAMAVFVRDADAVAFSEQAAQAGFAPLDFRIHAQGLHRVTSPPP